MKPGVYYSKKEDELYLVTILNYGDIYCYHSNNNFVLGYLSEWNPRRYGLIFVGGI